MEIIKITTTELLKQEKVNNWEELQEHHTEYTFREMFEFITSDMDDKTFKGFVLGEINTGDIYYVEDRECYIIFYV